jgi:hypothetical protein
MTCGHLLMISGARRDILNYCGHGSHPIHIATENGYIDIVRELIADKNNQPINRQLFNFLLRLLIES